VLEGAVVFTDGLTKAVLRLGKVNEKSQLEKRKKGI
jgi:hypothetical protein